MATANSLEPLSPILQDRLDIVELPPYTIRDKKQIVKGYIWPKLIKEYQIEQVDIEEDAIEELIALCPEEGVRDLERMAAAAKKAKAAAKKPAEPKPTFYSEVELSLKNEMHRKVHINPSGNGKGTLTIEFLSDDELAEFAKKLSE